MMPRHDIECPDCGGLGQTLLCGALVPCVECEATGRVEAVKVYDYYGAFVHDEESFPPYLLAVPKEFRAAGSPIPEAREP